METILHDVLGCVYSYAVQALIFTILLSFAVLFFEQNGRKNALRIWHDKWKESNIFGRRLLFYFYVYIVLARTLFNRTMLWDSLDDVLGGWWLERNPATGNMVFEAPENILLFIPLMFLLFLSFPKTVWNTSKKKLIGKSIIISFLVSFFIESNQLVFRIGTFQISDLVYNTLGGVLGCLFYFFVRNMKHTYEKRKQ